MQLMVILLLKIIGIYPSFWLPEVSDHMMNIPLPIIDCDDEFIWGPTANGKIPGHQ